MFLESVKLDTESISNCLIKNRNYFTILQRSMSDPTEVPVTEWSILMENIELLIYRVIIPIVIVKAL